MDTIINDICAGVNNDRTRLLDICNAVQDRFGCVSSQAMNLIANTVHCHRVEVESVVSFYAFLSTRQKGRIVIRLCNDIIDRLKGADAVGEALCAELGIGFGQTTADGDFTLEHAPCIGLSDQAPAALVNHVPVTELTPDLARQIVRELRAHMDPQKLVHEVGDGNNADPLVHSMVNNHIRNAGPFALSPCVRGLAIANALAGTPEQVIDQIKEANLRGRGGAGFPTASKWQFTRAAAGDRKIIVCNADEGEPGTFKDRVILTERPDRMLAGMTIAAYAIGSEEGIIYLRAEYQYLRRFLEHTIEQRRRDNLLGKNITGKAGFNFDVRIQLGAGAYICGEETALLSSCEGKRGDPKTRPPFPAQRGYLGLPTLVNNVETYCKATKILQDGPACFMLYGSHESTGTKLLSISGDCDRPGTYEVPFDVTIRSLLHMTGADDAIAVQISGAAGRMIGLDDFDHMISYSDLPTGGSFMIFGPGRNILEIVHAFMEFFCDESCGYCTPCRVGNVLLKQQLENIMAERAQPSDLDDMKRLCQTIHATSRCGLGETSPNPVLSSLENFPEVYEAIVKDRSDGRRPTFDVRAALGDAEAIAGRDSVHFAPKVT